MMNGTTRIHGVMNAEQYDQLIRSIVPSQPMLLSTIIDYLPPGSRNILELGCGTGILTGMVRDACPDAAITGIDLSPEMLTMTSAKPGLGGVRFLAQDLRDAWPAERYDAIITSLCLHHVFPEERVTVARRAARALVPGGRFICGDIFGTEHAWEEQVLREIWCRDMRRRGTPDEVIEGMIAQREKHIPTFTTISWFRDMLAGSGFSRVMVPFTSGFVGLVVGFSPEDERPGDDREGVPGNREQLSAVKKPMRF